MSGHCRQSADGIPEDLMEYFEGRRVILRMYDVEEHPEYERGVLGTMTRVLPNLAWISADVRGHVSHPVAIGVRLDRLVSCRNYESGLLMQSQDMVLFLHDIQVLMDLVRCRRTTNREFYATVPVNPQTYDASLAKLTDLIGFSKEVNVELPE